MVISARHGQNCVGEHTSSPVSSSGAQQPLRHGSFVAQRAAHDVPVTVEWTQTALAQHGCPVCVLQSPPGVAHEPAQYNCRSTDGRRAFESTLQQPLVHGESLRQVAAHTAFAGSFVSKTYVLPLQHAFLLPRQLPPGVVQAAPLGTVVLLQPPATTAPATAITTVSTLPLVGSRLGFRDHLDRGEGPGPMTHEPTGREARWYSPTMA